jgi:hypothetical protein
MARAASVTIATGGIIIGGTTIGITATGITGVTTELYEALKCVGRPCGARFV